MFTNTGEMCVVQVADANREDRARMVDLGNYFKTEDGQKVLVTSLENAKKYGELVNVPIYTRKSNSGLSA